MEKRFDLGSNVDVYLISPLKNKLKVHAKSSTHVIEKISLDSKKEKTYEFNLLNEYIVYENITNYEWNEKGTYLIYAEYKSLSGEVIISTKNSFEYN